MATGDLIDHLDLSVVSSGRGEGRGNSAALGETLTVRGGSPQDVQIDICLRDSDRPNANGDNPTHKRVDLIVGQVTGPVDDRGQARGSPPHNEGGHTWRHPDAQLKDCIINGKLGFGQMPACDGKLTKAEVDAILTHIKTWWTPEHRESQADVSRRYPEALDKYNSGPQ